MADMLHLEIIAPTKEVLSIDTPWVTLPGTLGELGILPQHVPVVTTLSSGVLQYEQGNSVRRVAVHYGYAQVRGDTVTVLSDMAEDAEGINRDRAQDAERKAREELDRIRGDRGASEQRMSKWGAKLNRALSRLHASN